MNHHLPYLSNGPYERSTTSREEGTITESYSGGPYSGFTPPPDSTRPSHTAALVAFASGTDLNVGPGGVLIYFGLSENVGYPKIPWFITIFIHFPINIDIVFDPRNPMKPWEMVLLGGAAMWGCGMGPFLSVFESMLDAETKSFKRLSYQLDAACWHHDAGDDYWSRKRVVAFIFNHRTTPMPSNECICFLGHTPTSFPQWHQTNVFAYLVIHPHIRVQLS